MRTADGLDASPVLHNGDLSLSGSSAIARRLAAGAAGRLYPRAPFDDASRQLAAEIDAWLDYGPTLRMVRGLPLLRDRRLLAWPYQGTALRTQGGQVCWVGKLGAPHPAVKSLLALDPTSLPKHV